MPISASWSPTGGSSRTSVLDRLAMVNIHFSLLPRWRGAAPVERAILAGDRRTGVCLMAVDEGLDTGAVYRRAEVDDRPPTQSLDELRGRPRRDRRTRSSSTRCQQGLGEPVPQEGEPVYADKIGPDELEIDWFRDTSSIHRLVSASAARGRRSAASGSRSTRRARPSGTGEPGSIDGHVVAAGRRGARARRACSRRARPGSMPRRGATAPGPAPTTVSSVCDIDDDPARRGDRGHRAHRREGAYANVCCPRCSSRPTSSRATGASSPSWSTARLAGAGARPRGRPVPRAGPTARRSRAALRIGAHQLIDLGTPPHAAVSATVSAAPKRFRGMVNAVLRKVATAAKAGIEYPTLAVELSYPDWIVTRLSDELGSSTADAALRTMNEPPTVHDATTAMSRTRVRSASPRSCRRRRALVLDLCAAPGGKATAIAGRGATVVAADRETRSGGLVAGNVERLGLDGVIPVVADGTSPPFAPASFDSVLVDAPCSGLGALRRRPDARWRITPTAIDSLARLQIDLLASAAPLVRPGGTLVYSVCTLTRQESVDVVAACDDRLAGLGLVGIGGAGDGVAVTSARVWRCSHPDPSTTGWRPSSGALTGPLGSAHGSRTSRRRGRRRGRRRCSRSPTASCTAPARTSRGHPRGPRRCTPGGQVVERAVTEDGRTPVARALAELANGFHGLIVTTGGTGFGPRDRTPEGTHARHRP